MVYKLLRQLEEMAVLATNSNGGNRGFGVSGGFATVPEDSYINAQSGIYGFKGTSGGNGYVVVYEIYN